MMQATPPSEIVTCDGRVYHLGLAADELAPNLFLVGDPARALRVAARFERVDHEVRHREFVTLTGTYQGLPMSVIGTGIGADNVEIALIEAYVLHEFDLEQARRLPNRPPMTVIRVGTSGGAQVDIQAGTLGISNYAIGLDNTGRFFEQEPADSVVTELEIAAFRQLRDGTRNDSPVRGTMHPYAAKASPEVVTALEHQAGAQGADWVTGVTITAPGFYGASGRFIEGLVNTVPNIKAALAEIEVAEQRVINFEMESSLLFRLAGSMGYRAATLCPIISNPSSHASVVDYGPAIEQAISIALEAMVSLTKA